MVGSSVIDWGQVSRELLRALRGHRSQVQLARRLKFRSNVPAAWEGGHRVPRVSVFFTLAETVGVDVPAALNAFHGPAGDAFAEGLAPWLRALKGGTTAVALAERGGLSASQVRRWLTGVAEPRLHEWLRLVDAMTGRAAELVVCFAPVEDLPTLQGPIARMQAQRRLAVAHPWTAAIRVWLEAHPCTPEQARLGLQASLGLELEAIDADLQRLADAGLVVESGGLVRVEGSMTLDLRSAEERYALRAHWAQAAASRLPERRDDLFSYSIVAVNHGDLERIRALQRRYWRELRGLVAASESPDTAALVVAQVCALEPG